MKSLLASFVFIVLVDASSVTMDDISFYLFDSQNTGTRVTIENVTIPSYHTVFFLIAGWTSTGTWYAPMTSALLAKNPANNSVIQVNWYNISKNLDYPHVASETPTVGGLVATFIRYLLSRTVNSPSNIQIIGHSLGAHVAGFAGQQLKQSSLTISRITGLDPAGPCYVAPVLCAGGRLTKNDATVVVIVHSDRYGEGYPFSFGAVDFFPNNGAAPQPGCNLDTPCDHARAYKFFTDALNYPGTLIGYKCNSYDDFKKGRCNCNKHLDMGGSFTEIDYDDYYLTTNADSPYGQGPRICLPTKKHHF